MNDKTVTRSLFHVADLPDAEHVALWHEPESNVVYVVTAGGDKPPQLHWLEIVDGKPVVRSKPITPMGPMQ